MNNKIKNNLLKKNKNLLIIIGMIGIIVIIFLALNYKSLIININCFNSFPILKGNLSFYNLTDTSWSVEGLRKTIWIPINISLCNYININNILLDLSTENYIIKSDSLTNYDFYVSMEGLYELLNITLVSEIEIDEYLVSLIIKKLNNLDLNIIFNEFNTNDEVSVIVNVFDFGDVDSILLNLSDTFVLEMRDLNSSFSGNVTLAGLELLLKNSDVIKIYYNFDTRPSGE